MTLPLLADTVDVDPFSGVDIPTLWIVCLGAFLVFGVAAAYLNFLRRNSYDDRAAWNYGAGMIVSGLLSGGALIVVLNGIFSALSGIAGLVVVAALLIYLGQSGPSQRRR